MQDTVQTEIDAGILQAAITIGLVAVCALLYRRYRKPYFLWWAIAWTLYALRLGAIITFISTKQPIWLYWHQVVTGWTALALLWAALVFSRQLPWRWGYFALVLFPLVWSYIAIYRLDDFLLAAGPAVLFLSVATIWTGVVFHGYYRRTRSSGAAFLAGTFFLWGLHHLDYPLLRARGAWAPWGYYLDILFELALSGGILLLVLEDIQRGLGALGASARSTAGEEESLSVLDVLLSRSLSLPGVRGSAVYMEKDGLGEFIAGVGACAVWIGTQPEGPAARTLAEVVEREQAEFSPEWTGSSAGSGAPFAYAAVLPVLQQQRSTGALVIVGDARDPFPALDRNFLIALSRQVGAALENADLYRRLEARTHELERLSARMIQQHEEQRRRLSLELHDETAQVFSAVKLQLGVLREASRPETAERFDHVLRLVDTGIRSIRNVTEDLRPSLLDDLGLLPALRALVWDFAERTGLSVTFDAPPCLPVLSDEAELAVFRALQEGLSNTAKHARATTVGVAVAADAGVVSLEVVDDGRHPYPETGFGPGGGNGHMGLTGMRERITALGGTVRAGRAPSAGFQLAITVPVPEQRP